MFVLLIQDVGGGWWEARNQYGRTGLIPKDYVEILPDDSLPEPSMPPPPLPTTAPPPVAVSQLYKSTRNMSTCIISTIKV